MTERVTNFPNNFDWGEGNRGHHVTLDSVVRDNDLLSLMHDQRMIDFADPLSNGVPLPYSVDDAAASDLVRHGGGNHGSFGTVGSLLFVDGLVK